MGEFRLVCVYVCFFLVIFGDKNKNIKLYHTKVRIIPIWLDVLWQMGKVSIENNRNQEEKKKKHTLSYTIILMIWLNWIEQWLVFGINSPFSFVLNWTQCFFFEKKNMKFLRKKTPHINDEYNGHCRCIKINFNRLHWQWMAPRMKIHIL